MFGTLKVVPKLADVPPDELNAPPIVESAGPVRPFVQNWKMEELTSELSQLGLGRNYARGKSLFAELTCLKCHKMGEEGGLLGPNLAELPKKLSEKRITRQEILQAIVQPSAVIEDKYRILTVVTTKGEVFSGMVVDRNAEVIRLQAGPDEKPREVKVKEIDEKQESKISLMPERLLDTLTREEIRDLLAYLVFGGDAKAPAFK
jgi:putative heme-binding domain-containing protein